MGIIITGQAVASGSSTGTELAVAPEVTAWNMETEGTLNLDTQGKAIGNFYVQLTNVARATQQNAIVLDNVIDGASGVIILDAGNDVGACGGLAFSLNGALVVNNANGTLTFGVDGRQVVSYFFSNLLANISPVGGFLVTVGKSYT